MKKEAWFFLILFFFIGTSVYAQNTILSAGGGILSGASFYDEFYEIPGFAQISGFQIPTIRRETRSSEFNLGIFTFLDIKYVELNMAIYWGVISENYNWTDIFPETSSNFSGTSKHHRIYFDFGILAKYPFSFQRVNIFPLLGLQYTILFMEIWEDMVGIILDFALENLYLKFGGGIDYMLNNRLFLRGNLLYRFSILNGHERAILRNNPNSTARFSAHGPQIRIGIGHKF